MSLFKKIFSKEENSPSEKKEFPWTALQNLQSLEEIIASKGTTHYIFKHSIRCGISASVIKQFENKYQDNTEGAQFHYLDLITFRPVSNQIEADLGVHQSLN